MKVDKRVLFVLVVVVAIAAWVWWKHPQRGGDGEMYAIILEDVPRRHFTKLSKYLADFKGIDVVSAKELVNSVPVEVYRTSDANEAVSIMDDMRDTFNATVKIV